MMYGCSVFMDFYLYYQLLAQRIAGPVTVTEERLSVVYY